MAALSAVIAGVVALWLASAPAFAAPCGNEGFRAGASARLPDCRAYELVTPADKEGAQDMFAFGSVTDQALPARNGERIALRTFAKLGPSPGSGGGFDGSPLSNYVFSRDASGWHLTSLTPSESGQTGYLPDIFSADLGEVGVVSATYTNFANHEPGQRFETGVPGGPYRTVATTNIDENYSGTTPDHLLGASSDFTHVVLGSTDPTLLPAASGTVGGAFDLYEWVDGKLRLVNVTTAGSLVSACGAQLGDGYNVTGPHADNAVSSDGSKIFFVSPDPYAAFLNGATDPSCQQPQHLYMRVNDDETVDVSEPEPGVNDPNGYQPVFYQGASADGTRVYFTTRTELTADDTTHDPELYEYDANTRTLTRISRGESGTADGFVNDSEQGHPVAISADGSTVYFEAQGQLTADAPEPTAVGGEWNLYSYATATEVTHYVATIDTPFPGVAFNPTTPDGRFFMFVTNKVVGLDSGSNAEQVYRYDAGDGGVICVSCSPQDATVGASIPYFTESVLFRPDETPSLRAMSNDGSYVFFDTRGQLVAPDSNTVQDVYEWHDGVVALISSGEDSLPSAFLGSSADGRDVFFATHSQLVSQDTDSMGDIYDARIGGGFPAAAAQAAQCAGDECQGGLTAAPSLLSAASIMASGPGNASGGPSATRVRIIDATRRNATLVVRLSVPAPGKIRITGRGLVAARHSFTKRGVYRVAVRLRRTLLVALKHKRRRELAVHVAYTPMGASRSSVTVSLPISALRGSR